MKQAKLLYSTDAKQHHAKQHHAKQHHAKQHHAKQHHAKTGFRVCHRQWTQAEFEKELIRKCPFRDMASELIAREMQSELWYSPASMPTDDRIVIVWLGKAAGVRIHAYCIASKIDELLENIGLHSYDLVAWMPSKLFDTVTINKRTRR